MQRLFKILSDLVTEAYISAVNDRSKLHQIEWENGDDNQSVLVEAEIRKNYVIGLALGYIKHGNFTGQEHHFKEIDEHGVYNSPLLLDWLVNEGNNYKTFALYLHYTELLRLTLSEFYSTRY
jgi:hypothetical protein